MKKILLSLILAPLFLTAQVITTQPTSLNFGSVDVGKKDSLQLTITNSGSQSLDVTNIKFYVIYGDFPFSASQTSFTLNPGASQNVWIYVEPEHNTLHNSELVIQHNATSGVEAVDIQAQGVFPDPYYNNTQNLSEEALKSALKTRLAQGYNQRSYNQARDAMYGSIDNNNGQVECAYTGRTATFSTRSGANNNSFNCEHTFPQGFFNQNLPMRSDIHHLFSTDVNANSQRSNLPFGVVSGSGTWSQGGSKKGSGLFEPRNAQKGRTARAMMYFVIRYQDYANHFAPQESVLRGWHNTFPPNAAEKQRNDDIYSVQNNRNPFVDYPQFEERITNFVSNSVAPTQYGLDILQTSVNFGNFTANQPDTFDYVLVNRGNQLINFSNFALSNTSILSFATGSGNNISINPGDALEISIIVQSPTGQLNENLTFNTNIPGSQSSFTIPISGNAIVTSLSDFNLKHNIEVFPNPFVENIYIRTTGNSKLEIRMLDAVGKALNTEVVNTQKGNYKVLTNNLPKGLYFIEINDQAEKVTKKLIK